MTRIEWTRYSGEDIEALVAMFVSGDYPAAERIAPSKGDGGIDILVQTDKTRVYQVKKFTGPLSTSQKKQVKKSVDRLRTDPRVKDLQVDEWHLVMPWDPTLEAKKWLTKYVSEKGLPNPIWDGLTQCDLWASKYPNIVDYYLHGNSDRIRQMALSMVQGANLKHIREEDIGSRDIEAFASELRDTVVVLNREDPFYIYGIHIDPPFKEFSKEDVRNELKNVRPGLILSTLMSDGQVSVRVDVYPKNKVALQLNPLKINVVMSVPSGSDEETAIRDFEKFGSPLELSTGVSGSSNFPGGLGGDFSDASVTVLPTFNFPEVARELRLVLFNPDNQQIDSLVIYRDYTTTGLPVGDQGPRGMETRFFDIHGVLEILLRLDVDDQTSTMSTMVHPPSGKLAVDVLPVLRFYQKMKAPNTLTAAPRFGPIPELREPLLAREGNAADLWVDIAESLNRIQSCTAHSLHFPDLEEVEESSIVQILRAGTLLQGQTLTERHTVVATDHDPEASSEIRTITLLVPWVIELPEGSIDLGHLAYSFAGSLQARDQALEGGRYDQWSVDDGKVFVRVLTEEEQKALPDTPVLGTSS